MTQRLSGTLIALIAAAPLMLAATPALAGSGAPRNAFASTHMHGFRHHRPFSNGAFTYWPGYGDDFSAPPTSAPLTDIAPPASGEITYTYKNDVPWDWAHRFPPNVAPGNRPYVPSCSEESVTVPGRGGAEQTVNVTRCY